MPALYDRLGIRFQYPENWSLDDGETASGGPDVTVSSPSGSFWSVAVHPAEADLAQLLGETVSAMREVYNELDLEPLEETVAGEPMQGLEMNFYCLDLTSSAWVRVFRRPGATYLVFCQAEDRDLPVAQPVFLAMIHSLLGSLPPAPAPAR